MMDMLSAARSILSDATFLQQLLTIDTELADACRAAGCPVCGGRLHCSTFIRKPRGWLGDDGPPEAAVRFSFCCARDGCRKRVTPRSVRFLGRKVFLCPAVVLVSALRNANGGAQRVLAELVGVSRRTVRRWHQWWTRTVIDTPFWKAARADVMPPVDTGRLPASLLERRTGDVRSAVVNLLRWLTPLTGGCHISQVL